MPRLLLHLDFQFLRSPNMILLKPSMVPKLWQTNISFYTQWMRSSSSFEMSVNATALNIVCFATE